MKGIVIEGVSAIGKSTILQGIQQKVNEAYPNSTKLYISEHYTQRMLEHLLEKNELESVTIRKHVDRVIKNVKMYQDMLDQSKFSAHPSGAQAFVTVERFLFTYLMMSDNALRTPYSRRTAARQFKAMMDLNFTQYLLVASPSKLKDNISKTLTHRNDAWASYVASKGGVDTITETSLNWQKNMVELSNQYKKYLPTRIIEVDNKTYQEIIDEIFDYEFSEQ